MMQLIFGAALGTILGQGLLLGIGRLFASPQAEELRNHVPKLRSVRGAVLLAGFIKYAGALGACVALITLGVWAVEDYLGARSARNLSRANMIESSASGLITQSPTNAAATLPPPPSTANAATSVSDNALDPYNDSEFKVSRKLHRRGAALSLKETLVQRSEAKARADLLKEMQQRVSRSQYDCEAAEHASQYLKADLDVWGFSSWQLKYFPMDHYQGATLAQCRDIQTVVDHSGGLAANR